MTTRFLLFCITSNYYDGEKTLDDLHEAISIDAKALYENGFKAPRHTSGHMVVSSGWI